MGGVPFYLEKLCTLCGSWRALRSPGAGRETQKQKEKQKEKEKQK